MLSRFSETESATNRESIAGLLMKLAQGQGGQACGSRKMLYRTAPLLGPVWMSEVLQNSSVKLLDDKTEKKSQVSRAKKETTSRHKHDKAMATG